MSSKSVINQKSAWVQPFLDVLICIALAFLGWFIYYTTGIEDQDAAGKAAVYKYIMVVGGLGMVALLWLGELERLRNLPSLLLIGYAAFSAISVFWAVSGRLFIQRYSVVFTAMFFFLYAVLRGRGNPAFIRRAMGICAGISTIYAVLGVEAASTGLFKKLAEKLTFADITQMQFAGRLDGVFGNPNIEVSFYALGIVFSIALLIGAEKKSERALLAALIACDAFAMVLGISLGGITCFIVASVFYLISAGEKRGAVLTRLVLAVLCGGAFALLGYKLYIHSHTLLFMSLLLAAAVSATLELLLGERISKLLAARQRIVFGTLGALMILALVYLIVGMRIAAPFVSNETVSGVARYYSLAPGEHTIDVETDEPEKVYISVVSQNEEQIVTQTGEQIFWGQVTKATFSVPEGSESCQIYVSAEPGVTLRTAMLDGTRTIVLRHRILPEFIASRLYNMGQNYSVRQRFVFVRDGVKLFCLSPIAGLGSGAFESSVSQVQDYEYETVHSHNQYIETLLEGGMVGFALFLGTLITLGIVLFKARKRVRDNELKWIYPALCAEFVMSTLQMLWDVSMSVTIFACMIYTLYGVIVSLYAEPVRVKDSTREQSAEGGKKKRNAEKNASDAWIRLACCALPVLFAVSVGLNIHAQSLIRQPVETLDAFMAQLVRAVRIDLYEHNDIKLSYVRAQMENDEEDIYRAQADEYARQLSTVQSNSIPYILVVYYLNTQQYELAIEEAKNGARYSASDSEAWNNVIDALKQMFIDSGANSPLLSDDGTLLRGLTEYYEQLQKRDAVSLRPISLNENSVEFFEKLVALNGCGGDRTTMKAVLVSRLEG